GAAAAAAGAPRALGPAAGRARLGEAGPAHGDDVSARRRIRRAVAAVARAGGDDDAGGGEGLRGGAGGRAVLGGAVAVGDGVGAHRGGRVDGGAQVGHGGAVGLDQEDLAAGAGGAHHVEIERDLAGPAGVGLGERAGLAVLVDLLEAAVGGGAGR